MRDYNEPISDAGHVVGDGLVQRIADLEKTLAEAQDWKDQASMDLANLRKELLQAEADCREAADRANLWETRAGIAGWKAE